MGVVMAFVVGIVCGFVLMAVLSVGGHDDR